MGSDRDRVEGWGLRSECGAVGRGRWVGYLGRGDSASDEKMRIISASQPRARTRVFEDTVGDERRE